MVYCNLSAYTEETRDLLNRCDHVAVLNEGYHPGCLHKRNRYMVEKSTRCIAVYDGREKGGTASTIRYAQTIGCEVNVIKILKGADT